MVFRLYNLVKGSLFFAFILFVVNRNSESWFFEYARYAFLIVIIWGLLFIIVSWFAETYDLEDNTFHIRKGVFVKRTNMIPFSRIQNVTRKTSFFHKLMGLTSVTFETAMDGKDDSVHFEVLTKKNADNLISLVKPGKQSLTQKENESNPSMVSENEEVVPVEIDTERELETNRTIHFTPKRKDLWKASFTSLSFLAIIPIVFAALDYIEPFLAETNQVEGYYEVMLASVWLLVAVIVLVLIIAVGFGVIRTFVRYGKYEISSDETHVYIHRGVLEESYFAIEKKKIQGLEIQQTFMKRLFGLAEVKLISSASKISSGEVSVNSLYPFLPMNQAFELINEILPSYQLEVKLERLPKNSLWVKLLRPSWFWIMATIALTYFKPDPFQIEPAWWIASLILLFVIVLQRILDYIHTKYAVTEDQVQWWHGGLTSRMFITKRKNVIEMTYSQSRLQTFFNVASITTINRATPVHVEEIKDIPVPYAMDIKAWYSNRHSDVQLIGKE